LAFKKYVAIFIVIFAIITLFNNSLSTLLLIGIGLVVLFFIIRLLADLYWLGKKRGDW